MRSTGAWRTSSNRPKLASHETPRVLRRAAVAQIEALSREGPDHTPYDLELVEAVMTDDGGPPPEAQADTRSSDGMWKQIELPLLTPVADMLGVR